MLLTVRLIQKRQQFVAVPESAVVPIQNKQFAYLVEAGKAVRREFQAGRRIPGFVEVLSGLEIGERVITEGAIKIRPGSSVRFKNELAPSGEVIASKAKAGEVTVVTEGD